MFNDRCIARAAVAAGSLVLLLGLVGTAGAKQFSMSGNWAMEKTRNFFIPLGGGAAGVPGSGTVQATGAGPAKLIVPPGLFTGTFAAGFPLPQTSVVQLTTQFTFNGPATTATLAAGNWTQTRAFPNFAWCPGAAANPACTTHRSTGQGAPAGMGTKHGLIRYTAGVQQYGGTMQMLRGGVGVLSLLIGISPTLVQHNPIAATGIAVQAVGGPYGYNRIQPRPGGPITQSPGFSSGGMITVPGSVVGSGTGTTNAYDGFPMTTGQVYVRVSLGVTGNSTFTVTGSDARTLNGAGNITLVAGGLAHRVLQGRVNAYEDTLTMTMASPTPSMSPAGLAAGALLLLLAVGYAMRRRI